jgi:hypothetical protein
VQTLISAARGVPDDADASAPVIRTSGASSVAFEQRARDKKLRIESENGRAKRGKGSRRDQSADVTSSESRARGDQASTEPKKETTKRGKDSNGGASSADAEKKSKSSKKGKKQGDKKGNKRQNSQLTDG